MIQQRFGDVSPQGLGGTIEWIEPPARPDMDSLAADRHAARLGAGVAFAICAAIASVGWLLDPNGGWMPGVIGLPGTTFLAWRMAAGSIGVSAGTAAGRAIGLALATILLTDALVVTVVSIGGAAGAGRDLFLGLLQSVGVAVYLYVIGALVVGIPVSVIVLPAALGWVFTVRWLANHGWAR